MRPRLVIVPASGFNFVLRVLQAHEPVFVQTLLAPPAVKALHHGVVGGLVWPAEVQLYPAFISPFVHDLADELAAVI